MKKIAFLLALMATISTQAASFSWSSNGVKVSFNGTTLTSGATVYLVYLGTKVTDASTMFTVNYEAPGTITPKAEVMTTEPMTTGRNIGAFSDTYAGDKVVNDNSFGAYITYSDGTDTWYNFSSSIYTVSGISIGNEILSTSFAFNFSDKTEITDASQTVSTGSGWVKMNVVPEPSTAMLALAGLALLIKRRKA